MGKDIPEKDRNIQKAARVTLSWSKEEPEEIALAEKKFKEYIRKGWLAFVVTPENHRVQVFTFHPEFGTIQLVPIAEGG